MAGVENATVCGSLKSSIVETKSHETYNKKIAADPLYKIGTYIVLVEKGQISGPFLINSIGIRKGSDKYSYVYDLIGCSRVINEDEKSIKIFLVDSFDDATEYYKKIMNIKTPKSTVEDVIEETKTITSVV